MSYSLKKASHNKMKTAKIVALTVIIEIIVFIGIIFSGFYNVSALSPDPSLMQWVLGTTSDRSVEHHAGIVRISNITDTSLVKTGFLHFNEMCVGCHGAPGVKRSEIGQGLFPKAPDLTESAKEMPVSELFWVIKNGIKSTGMPAFGKTHSDHKIEAIVAFLEKMKSMSGQDYAAMRKAAGNKKMDTSDKN